MTDGSTDGLEDVTSYKSRVLKVAHGEWRVARSELAESCLLKIRACCYGNKTKQGREKERKEEREAGKKEWK